MNSNIKILSEVDQNILINLVKIHFSAFKKFNLRPWKYKDFIDFLNSGFKVFYYVSEKKILGFIIVNCNLDFIEIITIAIDKPHQRKKIGNSLLQYVINYGRLDKFLYIEVAKNNYGAIDFYKKHGFNICSERKNYYLIHSGKDRGSRIDALIMKLIL
ncbi:MAG: hypothetical protein CMJ12_01600 [Pelagibacterales bacterium]|nr:hypothetical protein [Pelagibacterales bacterium]PPR16073.1 MAG: hypothetical protein CFH33_00999 [Alphaproteobacteria bacterium MarineAlpha9_Bin3]|tara:strand:- start:15832 stop:16305 length:474 start_codon:yes stop_codon:yes gene_type:complete